MLAQVWAQVRDQVRAQVKDQVGAQVGAQVRDQVRAQVKDQVGAQVWDQVMAQVWDQVMAQVRDQVMDQVRDQVRDQVMDQVWDQVRAQVMDQVWDQVGDQIGAQVWDQVWDQVMAQVRDQVRDQVMDQVWDQVRAQVRAQVWDQVGDQVGDQIGAQVWDQVRAQVMDQVRTQVWDQVGDQVRAQVRAQVRDQVWDQVRAQVGRAGYGQHDANWLGFYEFFQIAGGMGCVNPLQGLMAIAKSCGWWWPFQGAVILTERPCSLHRDERNLLHHPSEMAIRYPDGWGIYAWHGTRIPARYYEVKPTAQEILVEPNAEVRRALIERMGQDRFILDCNPNVLDEAPQEGSNVPNQLLAIDLPADPDRRMVALKLSCPSTGACYILRVPPDQTKVREALAWTFNVPAYAPAAEA